jgi:hypothetical protein
VESDGGRVEVLADPHAAVVGDRVLLDASRILTFPENR